MKRVKLKDIAKLLNLSESTVSRALSNDEMISKKSQEKLFLIRYRLETLALGEILLFQTKLGFLSSSKVYLVILSRI